MTVTGTLPGAVDDGNDLEKTKDGAVRINVPQRLYLVPGTAIIVGSAIGIVRGSRQASLRFLAENVHRPPTTVQGWYFYNKTKNYKVLFGGLKGAGLEASRLGAVAAGWVGLEEGFERVGLGQFSEIGAALGTTGVFSAVYRLPWKMSQRALILGLIVGSGMKLLRLGRERLEERVGKIIIRK